MDIWERQWPSHSAERHRRDELKTTAAALETKGFRERSQLHRDSTSTRPTPLVPSSNDSLQPTSPVASSPVFNPIIHTPTVHNSSDHNTHPVSTHLLTTSAPVVTSPCLSRNHTSSSFGHSDDHYYDSPTVLVLHLSSCPPMTRHNLLLLSLAPLFSTLSFTHRLSTIPVTTTHPVSTHLLTTVAPVVTSPCLSGNHTSSSSGHSDDHHYRFSHKKITFRLANYSAHLLCNI
ncbi:hypothetical protein Bca4012_042219 [Brassica carinata]